MPRRETREEILSAARTVFSRKGFKAATVSDILRESGFARGTFYKYFSGKRQAFIELIQGFLRNLYENTRDYVLQESDDIEEFADRIRDGLKIFYRYFLENRELVIIYYREAFGTEPVLYAAWDDFDRRMTLLLKQTLQRGVERGMFRPMDTDLVARALLMIFLQVPYRYLMSSGRRNIDVESISREMVAFALEGILVRRGEGRLAARVDPLLEPRPRG